jgi:hypothetical protein
MSKEHHPVHTSRRFAFRNRTIDIDLDQDLDVEVEVTLRSTFHCTNYTPKRDKVYSQTFEDHDEDCHEDAVIDQKRDDWNIWYPHPDRTDSSDVNIHIDLDLDQSQQKTILQKVIAFHLVLFVATWFQN